MPRKQSAAGDIAMIESLATAKAIARFTGPGCRATGSFGQNCEFGGR